VVVRIIDNAAPQPAQKFTAAKFREWVATQLELAEEVHSCYEAGPFGFVLHRRGIRFLRRLLLKFLRFSSVAPEAGVCL
jgi:hypothetical protein